MVRVTLYSLVILYLVTVSIGAQEVSPWNQFRGPNGSGVAIDCEPPVQIAMEDSLWSVPVPSGLSSPIIAGDRVVLTALEDESLVTIAFDKHTGELLWRREAPLVPLEKVHETSSPVASTPCTDGERIYVYFGSYGLICYDLDGGEVWKRSIPTPRSLYGMSTSPIIHEGRLILVLDNQENLPDSELSCSKVIALNKISGESVWETARPFVRSGWSTPAIWQQPGGEELVILGSGRLYGYNAKTGEEKWFISGFSRETIAVPISGDGLLYASAAKLGGTGDLQPDPEPFWNSLLQFDVNDDGRIDRTEMTGHFTFPLRPELPLGHPGYGFPLPREEAARAARIDGILTWVDKDKDGFWTREEFEQTMSPGGGRPLLIAVEPGGRGDITESSVLWEMNRNIPEIPSPIFHNGRIYMVRDGGIVSAVDASGGRILYRERLEASGLYSASPVIANDCLYLASNDGVVSVIRCDDEFELLHQADLQDRIHATPAIDASTIYIRTHKRLFAFRSEN
jgi:outer membrane protein assembly factor BamB